MEKKLYRIKQGRMFLGICAGLGKYFEVDPVIIRLVFVLLAFSGGLGILLYLVLFILVPEEGALVDERIISATETTKKVAEDFKNKAFEVAQKVRTQKKFYFRDLLGFTLIGVGLIYLLEEIFSIHFNWRILFGILIIVLGVYFLNEKKD